MTFIIEEGPFAKSPSKSDHNGYKSSGEVKDQGAHPTRPPLLALRFLCFLRYARHRSRLRGVTGGPCSDKPVLAQTGGGGGQLLGAADTQTAHGGGGG